MEVHKMELPIAQIGRIIKSAGAQRISEDAKEALQKAIEEWSMKVATEAIKLANHAGRITVTAEDIELAVKLVG